jgi:hypothetical protein
MASPKVENLQPGEGDTGFTPTDPVRFSVRDEDTSINKSTVDSIITFSKVSYFPEALPAGDSYLDVFGDALPVPRPGVNVDQYLADDIPYDSDGDLIDDSFYGPVLTLEKAIAGENTEQGVLFVEADITEVTPVGCEVQMGIQSYTRGAASYFPDPDFVGAVAGFIYWPQNTGVFVFFKDDGGGVLSIEVTGPAQDGAGTRLVSNTTVYDWSEKLHAPVSIRVVWDPTPRRRKVWVFATNESSGEFEETLLLESLIDDLGVFQEAARMGIGYAESPPDKAVAIGGISSGDVGDFVEIHNINVDEYGQFLLASGGGTLKSEYGWEPSDSLLVSQFEDAAKWNTSELEDLVSEAGGTFTIEKEETSGNASMFFKESDLLSRRFILLFSGSVRSSVHSGSQSSGVGIDIDDGTSLTAIRFLDDFSEQRLGVLFDGTNRDTTTSFYVAASEWARTTPEILVFADAAQDLFDMFISEEPTVSAGLLDTAAISVPYPSVPSTYSSPTTSVGFVDGEETALLYAGDLIVDRYLLLPNARIFSPRSAIAEAAIPLPDQVGTWEPWVQTLSGTPTITEAPSEDSPYWSIEGAVSTDYAFYTLSVPADEYTPGEHGISLMARIQVNSWVDRYGATSTPRIPTCAVMALDTGDDLFAQLQFVVASTGEAYAFLSNSPSDFLEVLNQTQFGQEISTLVDLSQPHTYILSYKPGKGVFLFVDMNLTPAVSLAWTDRSAVQRESTYLSAGMTASVGVIPVSADGETASVVFGNIAVSTGSGFDFSVSMVVSDEVLEDRIFGAAANVFVDVTDKD